MRPLWFQGEADIAEEIRRLNGDPLVAGELAQHATGYLFRLSLPIDLASRVAEELSALGGRAWSAAAIDGRCEALLAGTELQLRSLAVSLEGQAAELRSVGHEIRKALAPTVSDAAMLVGRGCTLKLDRPRIMGILNVTPDSFSDGGRFLKTDTAVRHALQMVDEGADIIDVGGESTRPGAPEVAVQEELERTVPVIEALRRECAVPISIDTTKSQVARAAMAAGANFINDISGLHFDSAMPAVAAETGAGLFVMHSRGRPEVMQKDTRYADLIGEVFAGLQGSLAAARRAGIADTYLAVDPGIGFGKSFEGNLELLRRLREFLALGRPLLLGTSRKSFLGRVSAIPAPAERLPGSLATVALGVAQGASIFRVHDVSASRQAADTAQAIWNGMTSTPSP